MSDAATSGSRATGGPSDKAAPDSSSTAGFWARQAGGVHSRQTRNSQAAEAETRARDLIAAGARFAFGHTSHDPDLEEVVHGLVVGSAAGDPPLPAGRVATDLLMALVAVAWEGGWQPGDLAHIVRRHQSARVAVLAAVVVLEQAGREDAMNRAPADWVAQLESLRTGTSRPRPTAAVRHGGVPDGVWSITQWQHEQGITPWDGWRDILALIGQLQTLRRLTALGPVPSQWDSHRAAASARAARSTRIGGPSDAEAGSGHDTRMLSRIRALLAKAEATTFSEEADAFTSKAQDLMTRYAIDEALLDDSADSLDVPATRIHIDNPYAEAKVQLLSTVGEINRVRVIWDGHHGMATAVGMAVDLQLVEMMFTSLLVQATREMTHAGNDRNASGYQGSRLNRSPSFRRAFLIAYADRVGERLAESGRRAGEEASSSHGSALVPVLARRAAEVDSAFDRLFPDTTQKRATRVNARGWHAGRAAADRAVFAAGQVAATGS